MWERPFYALDEGEDFSFYQMPKRLRHDPQYEGLSIDACWMYGVLLDRQSLSRKNGWVDEKGRLFIIYSIEELMDEMKYSNPKIGKILNELEYTYGLIKRVRRGFGLSNIIYVRKFNVTASVQAEIEKQIPLESDTNERLHQETNDVSIKKLKVLVSRNKKYLYQETNDVSTNDTYLNNNYLNNIYNQSHLSEDEDYIYANPEENDGTGQDENCFEKNIVSECESLVKERIGYDYQKQMILYAYPTDQKRKQEDIALLDSIVEVVVDTMTTEADAVRVSGEVRPTEQVIDRLMELDSTAIVQVMDGLRKTGTDVKNIKQYLLAALYNAPIQTRLRRVIGSDAPLYDSDYSPPPIRLERKDE